MPQSKTIRRAEKDRKAGKRPSTQAGEFVREELGEVKAGKRAVKSTKQAIAIGLSKARRAGVALPAPAKGKTSAKTRKSAEGAYRRGQNEGPLRQGKAKAKAKPKPRAARARRKRAG
jgi:hypothetical protein